MHDIQEKNIFHKHVELNKRAKTYLKRLSAVLGIIAASELFLSVGLSPVVPSEPPTDFDACSDSCIVRHSTSRGHAVMQRSGRSSRLKKDGLKTQFSG